MRAGRAVLYTVKIRPTTKTTKDGIAKGRVGGQDAGSTLNIRVVLPARVRYVQSKASPPLLAYSARGRKMRRQPVQADGGLLTWEDIGPKRRKFRVKVIVNSDVAPGTLLPFSAYLFEAVPLGQEGTTVQACPLLAPNATLIAK